MKAYDFEFVWNDHEKKDYEKHNHVSKYIIGFVCSGRIRIATNEEEWTCEKDDLYWIPILKTHAVYQEEEHTTVLSLCLGTNMLHACSLEEGKAVIQECLNQIIANGHIEKEKADSFLHAYEMLYYQKTEKIALTKEMGQLKELFVSEPEKEMNLEKLANEVFISKYYMIRKFKESIGLTPHKFQMQNRIRKAKQMLQEGEKIAEVATATGFYDQSHFTRVFTDTVGISPGEYVASIIHLE